MRRIVIFNIRLSVLKLASFKIKYNIVRGNRNEQRFDFVRERTPFGVVYVSVCVVKFILIRFSIFMLGDGDFFLFIRVYVKYLLFKHVKGRF